MAAQHGFYADVQKERVRASMLASGITAFIYSFLQSGRKCTCRMQASILDDEGHLTQDGIDSILTSDKNAGHIFAGPVSKPVIDATDVGLDSIEHSYEELKDKGFFEGLDDEGLDENWADDDLNPRGGRRVISGGMNQDRCGICFGSGFVGGFRLSGGTRQILTTESPQDTEATTCRVDKTENPYKFIGPGRVVFNDVNIPYRQGQRLHILRMWNNDTPLRRSTYEINRTGIIAAAAKGVALSNVDVLIDDGMEFTHIEIQTSHRKVHVDLTQVPDNFHPNVEGRAAQATISLPPDTPVSKFSVIRESKYGRAWQVSQVNPHLNNRGAAIWYEVEARLVAQHELYNQLAGTS